MTSVLVVEDERCVNDPLAESLAGEGFTVAVVSTGPLAMDEFARHGADLVLLGLLPPGMRATEVCQALRARSSSVPVIIVSARAAEIDKVVAFEVGADDYVCRPYSTLELAARMRAVLRRRVPGCVRPEPELLRAGSLTMDVGRHRVTVAGREVTLPLREFELLAYLLRNCGLVLSRRQILDRVWGADGGGDVANTVEVHVNRIRSRIEEHPTVPRRLLTVRGIGYKITP
jgi:two-component system response regulator RegX3